jgi:hypothetical protein
MRKLKGKTRILLEYFLFLVKISALDEGKWSTSRVGRITAGERTPGGSGAGMDMVAKGQILSLLGMEPRVSSP